MRNWIAKLFGFDLEMENLRQLLVARDFEIDFLKSTNQQYLAELDSYRVAQQNSKADLPQPYNPRQSWGARKRRLEEMERKREVKAQVDTTEKYWKNKDVIQ